MLKKKMLIGLSILVLLLFFSACGEPADGNPVWQAYSGKRIGVQVGTTSGQQVEARIPDAVLLYYNTQTDLLAALRAKKIDACASDETIFRFLMMENDDLTILDGYLDTFEYAPIFAKSEKGRALRDQYSAFVDSLEENGTLRELDGIWYGKDEAKRTVLDYESLPDTNGTLSMAVDTSLIPFSYVKDNRVVGYDVDIAARFCQEYGYRLAVKPMDFAGVLASVQSGKVDFAACGITVTEERKESVLFGSPDYMTGAVLAVLSDNTANTQQNAADSGDAQTKSPITSFRQLAQPGIKIAVGLNTPAEETLHQDYPEAQLVPYSDIFLAYMDVIKGRVDACVNARKEMEFAIQNGLSGVHLLKENYASNKIAVGISPVSPIPDLKGKLNTFIAECKADGTLDDLYDRWVLRGEETMPDIPEAENPSFTLRVGTTGSVMPYSYYVGTELAGYDIELAHRFASWLGAKLELWVFDFGGIVPAAEAGRIDCIMSNLFYSEERDEGIPFSDVLFEVEITAMVRDEEQNGKSASTDGITSLSQLDGKRIGVQTGTTFDEIVLEVLPDAQISYYNSYPDLTAALQANKIDAYPGDEPVIRLIATENDKLAVLEERMDHFDFGIALPKTETGEKLLGEINAWLASMKESGELALLTSKWTDGPEDEKTVPDYASFPAPNGILTLATEGAYAPMCYYRGDVLVGLEIDLIARFCEANGYGLKVVPMLFDGILPAVQSGKADFAAAGLTITEERKESVWFSDPYYTGGTVMAVLKGQTASAPQAAGTVRWQDYNGKRLGVLTGPLMEDAAKESFPDSEYLLFNSYLDCIEALLAGKIDAYLGDEVGVKSVHAEQPDIDYIHDRITQNNYSFAFRKNDPDSAALCAELNEFLSISWENGTMQELEDIWFGADEERKVVDMSGLTGENGTIRVVTTSTDMPFSYIKDGKNAGYDIDLVVRFCRDRGYALELGDVDFAGRIPAIQSGKYDFTTDMNVTPEREEQVLFSDPTGYGGIVLAVKSSDLAAADAGRESADTESAEASFFDSIKDSFRKTFIREDRWKLFVDGVLTTLLITVLSILFGTMLGFLVFMLCRNGNAFANGVTRFCIWLVQGMPMVVLLMVLYYIIFGSVSISSIAVAVIGFTLTFGAAVFGLLKMGVGTIDRGQYEAAYALGHSNRHTFFRIILPQAVPHILPAYQGEIVGLIKATAIVGYIAVQDLTKMGDIVRSRTYEAFFPLIAITIIYFVLEGLFSLAVGRIRIRTDPKKRKRERILKGVKTHD